MTLVNIKISTASEPSLTSCKTPHGGKQNVCYYTSSEGNKDYCLGTSSGECPSQDDCKKEFESKTKGESKEWATWAITGNNTPNPKGGSSIPATKKCKFSPKYNNKQLNNINKYISVKCGDSPMYLASRLKKDDGSYNNLQITKPIVIEGKEVSVTGDMYMIWSALAKQAIDNEMENKSVKVQKIAGERKILEQLEAQGIDLSEINDRSDIDFSYTPPSKNHHDRAIFLVEDGPSSIKQLIVCPDQETEGYQSFFKEFPREINIKECAESIYIGEATTKVGMRSSMREEVACFGKKDELFCVNAKKCINEEYSSNKFTLKEVTNNSAIKSSAQNSGTAIED
jgi:hypothetical protein